MSRPPIPIKHCKTLLASGSTTLTAAQTARFFDKLLYEFWGFCVNGSDSVLEPGGIASLSYPDGFASGSNVLLATGQDGFTFFGSNIFGSTSIDFSAVADGNLLGKYLVTWVEGSDSFDDGIYQILRVEDPTRIRVDIHSAGTRRLGNHPFFWARSNINFRIVDIMEATRLSGWSTNHYMVLNFSGAPLVNPGQATTQVRVFHTSSLSGGSEGTVGLVISPSGSWNPGAQTFTDGTPIASGSFAISNVQGVGSAGTSNVIFSLAGASDFLMGHVRALTGGPQGNATAGSGFHIEIPQRLYSGSVDPNPVAWVCWTNATPSQVANTYYNGWQMVGLTGSVNRWYALVRSPMGAKVRSEYTGKAYGTGQWQQFSDADHRFTFMNYDQDSNQYITSDGVLSYPVAGQFSSRRVRLRHVRFTMPTLARGARLGDPFFTGLAWTHLANGVLWPWDNSILPERPWRYGA